MTESFIRVFNTRIKLLKNDQTWAILQQKTITIVFELDPLFLIRDKNYTPWNAAFYYLHLKSLTRLIFIEEGYTLSRWQNDKTSNV